MIEGIISQSYPLMNLDQPKVYPDENKGKKTLKRQDLVEMATAVLDCKRCLRTACGTLFVCLVKEVH